MSRFIVKTPATGWDAPDLIAFSLGKEPTDEEKTQADNNLCEMGYELLEWFDKDCDAQKILDFHMIKLAKEVNEALRSGKVQLPKLGELNKTSKRALVVITYKEVSAYEAMPLHFYLAYKQVVPDQVRLANPDEYDKEYIDSLNTRAKCNPEHVDAINNLLEESCYRLGVLPSK